MKRKRRKRKTAVIGTALTVCFFIAAGVWLWKEPLDGEKTQETAEQTEQAGQKEETPAKVIREDGTAKVDVQQQVDDFLSQVAEISGEEAEQ